MKIFKRILIIIFLLITLIYVSFISSLPDSIILFKGEELKLNTILGINAYEDLENFETVETGITFNNDTSSKKNKVCLKLFNLINVKDIEVNTIPKTTVIPLGNAVRT